MEQVVSKFSDFDAADRATREYYRSLTPQQRLEILFELIRQGRPENDADSERLAPVCRIVKLGQR